MVKWIKKIEKVKVLYSDKRVIDNNNFAVD